LPYAIFGSSPGGVDAQITCLRSVLMKPEHAEWLAAIWDRLSAATSLTQ